MVATATGSTLGKSQIHLTHIRTILKNYMTLATEVSKMSFFKHVQLHKYDLTDKGVSQACYDEITADLADAKNALSEEQLWVLADDMREKFKDYMRPLFV
tara:strand:+ start:429 stop:728 length:300 start_codon:yes stop_codon:yes gene_type:complete